ncbi:MAG: hypothetical protein ACREP8_13275 [Candidatus Binatia bacterium]
MSARRRFFHFYSWLTILFLVGCFGGVKRTGKVIGYEPGRVLTKKGYYQVGILPEGWRRINLEQALVAFRNEALQSTIATDSFCDQAYDDSSLPILTRHLFAGLQKIEVLQEQSFTLSDRGALRTMMKATLDGVPVMLEIVVVKKNWCLFDFYLVSPPERFAGATADFETFYRGFSYAEDGSWRKKR